MPYIVRERGGNTLFMRADGVLDWEREIQQRSLFGTMEEVKEGLERRREYVRGMFVANQAIEYGETYWFCCARTLSVLRQVEVAG